MKIKTVYELSEGEVTTLAAFIKLSLDGGIMFVNTTLENIMIHHLYSQFKERVNPNYFDLLLEEK